MTLKDNKYVLNISKKRLQVLCFVAVALLKFIYLTGSWKTVLLLHSQLLAFWAVSTLNPMAILS